MKHKTILPIHRKAQQAQLPSRTLSQLYVTGQSSTTFSFSCLLKNYSSLQIYLIAFSNKYKSILRDASV